MWFAMIYTFDNLLAWFARFIIKLEFSQNKAFLELRPNRKGYTKEVEKHCLDREDEGGG